MFTIKVPLLIRSFCFLILALCFYASNLSSSSSNLSTIVYTVKIPLQIQHNGLKFTKWTHRSLSNHISIPEGPLLPLYTLRSGTSSPFSGGTPTTTTQISGTLLFSVVSMLPNGSFNSTDAVWNCKSRNLKVWAGMRVLFLSAATDAFFWWWTRLRGGVCFFLCYVGGRGKSIQVRWRLKKQDLNEELVLRQNMHPGFKFLLCLQFLGNLVFGFDEIHFLCVLLTMLKLKEETMYDLVIYLELESPTT